MKKMWLSYIFAHICVHTGQKHNILLWSLKIRPSWWSRFILLYKVNTTYLWIFNTSWIIIRSLSVTDCATYEIYATKFNYFFQKYVDEKCIEMYFGLTAKRTKVSLFNCIPSHKSNGKYGQRMDRTCLTVLVCIVERILLF